MEVEKPLKKRQAKTYRLTLNYRHQICLTKTNRKKNVVSVRPAQVETLLKLRRQWRQTQQHQPSFQFAKSQFLN